MQKTVDNKECLIKEINSVITESLGINQEVSRVSSLISNEVEKVIREGQFQEKWNETYTAYINDYNITIPLSINEEPAQKINVTVYVIRYSKLANLYDEEGFDVMKPHGNSIFRRSGKTIFIQMNLVMVYDGFKPLFKNYDVIQHEVNHIFQQYMVRGMYPMRKEQGTIQNTMINSKFNTPTEKIHYLCYNLDEIEQDSQINGLYAYILNMYKDEYPGKIFNSVVKKSDCYFVLSRCKEFIDDLHNLPRYQLPDDNFFKKLGYSDYKKFLEVMNKKLRRFITKFGKVIVYIKSTIPNTLSECRLTNYGKHNINAYLLY